MRQLVLTPKFKRAYRKFSRRDKRLQQQIDNALRKMAEDIFTFTLHTHKLSGELAGFWASSCGYDCRILFAIEHDPTTDEEVIVLLDIGTHDEVY
jgi:addiction module RelE/StbE family toxin